MIEVVGVRFKEVGKIYYFDPLGLNFQVNEEVIVETARGVEYGKIVISNRKIRDDEIKSPLKPIMRLADEIDKEINKENIEKAKEAFEICLSKIEDHQLEMKLVDGEYTFDGQKLIFYFTAEGRIDFRDLVKDLAQIFRTRIELRQVGVRDHAKLLNDCYGQCGQKTCCSRHLGEFKPVSIKMAKDQDLSLNPNKISGVCGRLMCCLNYEEEVYCHHAKQLPKLNSKVKTIDGVGYVIDIMTLEKKVKVKLLDGKDVDGIEEYKLEDIEF